MTAGRIINADVLAGLRSLRADFAHCIVTSPPYWGLRVYAGVEPTMWGDGEQCCLGSEPMPELFVAHMVEVFAECYRVLRPDGCLWLNIGDNYAQDKKWGGATGGKHAQGLHGTTGIGRNRTNTGLAGGNLVGMPWRVALALQLSGWHLRAECQWFKPAPMPSSVNGVRWERCMVATERLPRSEGWKGGASEGKPHNGYAADSKQFATATTEPCPGCHKCRDSDGYILVRGSWRPTVSHEPIYLLTKGPRYFADRDAVATELADATIGREHYTRNNGKARPGAISHDHESNSNPAGANLRSVWRMHSGKRKYEFCFACKRLYVGGEVKRGMTKRPCACGAKAWVQHFAAFPVELPLRCIKASCSEAGCCAECGAQWARVVGTEYFKHRPSAGNDPRSRGEDRFTEANGTSGFRGNNLRLVSTTLGFRPTCQCRADKARPVVIDPFSGTGTSGIAAMMHDCDFIGIEASPQYAALSEARIEHWREFVPDRQPVKKQPKPMPDQPRLFTE